MPIISFWNPTESAQTGTTATMVAVANSIATRYPKYKMLLTQTHFYNMKMESSYFNMDKLASKGNLDDITDTGIDALDRLLRSNKISPESIPIYSKLKGKSIEVLYGSFKNDMDSFNRIIETVPFMLDYAVQCYDLVLVDLTKGTSVKEVNEILQKSDLIVVTMNQDKEVLKDMVKQFNTLKILQEKPVIPVFARYDRFLAYNARNILRTFNFKFDKKEVYVMPYNSQYFDACNDGRSLEFFVENMNADVATDRNGYFIHEVAHITDRVISALGNKLSEK
ncbi:MAG: hypothetical protein J6C46_01040 [Clostridia bacterium]|nr:hypothetical protein [Clostridia bacterium]